MQLEKKIVAGAETGATSTLHHQERENHSAELERTVTKENKIECDVLESQ